MTKEKVERGVRRRFEVYITDLDGNAQDPDACNIYFEKQGMYGYDSPSKTYACSKTGSTGYWGADIWIPESMTLGDWLAHFEWTKTGQAPNGARFEFTVIDKVRPYINRDPRTIAPNVKVIEE